MQAFKVGTYPYLWACLFDFLNAFVETHGSVWCADCISSDAAVLGGPDVERDFAVFEKVAGVGGCESGFGGGNEEEGERGYTKSIIETSEPGSPHV